jgi:hypothetical protein
MSTETLCVVDLPAEFPLGLYLILFDGTVGVNMPIPRDGHLSDKHLRVMKNQLVMQMGRASARALVNAGTFYTSWTRLIHDDDTGTAELPPRGYTRVNPISSAALRERLKEMFG